MIFFRRFTPEDKEYYEKILFASDERGCEYSFANLYLWGRQTFAEIGGCIVFFSQFNRRTVYPFPIGNGDKKAALDAIINDAAERGITCRITGITEGDKELLVSLYGDRFNIHSDRDSHDYVYETASLANLEGKKYRKKRGHLNNFREAYPEYSLRELTDENTEDALALLDSWYATRDEDEDFMMERCAINKAIRDRDKLGLEILLLYVEEKPCAMSVVSIFTPDTADVHFEKALTEYPGAYAAINAETAAYIARKYEGITFIDREEDMGIEGLRKAKLSYYPHHMVEKWWAHLSEDDYDY